MKALQPIRVEDTSLEVVLRYMKKSLNDPNIAKYILRSAKLLFERSDPTGGSSPIKLSQIMTATEAPHCCGYSSAVQKDIKLVEHDGRLAVVGSNGTGRTTSLINTLGEIHNASRVGSILLQWEDLRKQWLGNDSMDTSHYFP